MSKTLYFRLFLLIFCASFLFRLYKITTPLADWHSFRQADTASVTREYVKHGINLLYPRYHDLSNVQAGLLTGGKDNLEGWRMVEFPIINALIAVILRMIPDLDLVVTSRVVSVLFSMGTLVLLGRIARQLFDRVTSIFTLIVFGWMPYSIFYSRVILPEPFLVFFLTLSTYALLQYEQAKRKNTTWLLVFGLAFTLALLLKPMGIFMLPAFAGVVLFGQGIKGFFDPSLWVVGGITLVPVYVWREWIKQFPTGVPWSAWLYNFDHIRFRPAWWRWLFWERLTKLMLGTVGIVFFTEGLFPMLKEALMFIKKKQTTIKGDTVLLFWGAGMFAYLVVFATGNVRHDYYQVLLLPFVSLVVARGAVSVVARIRTIKQRQMQKALFLFLSIVSLVALFKALKKIEGYYHINHPAIIAAGKAADRLLPPEAKVIAPYNGDTAFLFQTNRTGWPIALGVEQKIANGAQYYISVNYDDEARSLEQQYTVIEKTAEYMIIDLTKPL